MTGRSATAGVAGGAGRGSPAGHSTTSGAGGTEPSDECGRMVLSWRRQPSMTTLASWSVEKISPLSSSSRSSPRSRRSSGLPPRPTDPAPGAPPPAAAWPRSPQVCASSSPSIRPPHGSEPYLREDHLSGGRPLKLFLFSFRNHGAFHEDCTVGIGKRLAAELEPRWLRIAGY